MPSMVVVFRIMTVSYNIIGSTTVILAQIKVCLAAIIVWWWQVRDIDTPPAPQNPSFVSLNDGWRPLKQWIGLLTAPHTHMPVQAGPTGAFSLGAMRLGLGWYGQHNGV